MSHRTLIPKVEQARIFSLPLDKTPNKDGQNATLEVEYYYYPEIRRTPYEGGAPELVRIETLSIGGHEMTEFFEEMGCLDRVKDEAEAAILAACGE